MAGKKNLGGRPREIDRPHQVRFLCPWSERRRLLYDARELDISIASVIRRILAKHYTGATPAKHRRRNKREGYQKRKRRELRHVAEDLIGR